MAVEVEKMDVEPCNRSLERGLEARMFKLFGQTSSSKTQEVLQPGDHDLLITTEGLIYLKFPQRPMDYKTRYKTTGNNTDNLAYTQ